MIKILHLALLLGWTEPLLAQSVIAIGALRDVKHNGRLSGTVQLDTLAARHVYGLGPVAELRGEILLWNDTVYVASVREDSVAVAVVPTVRAPFLVYVSVPAWAAVRTIVDTVVTLDQLQQQVEEQAIAQGKSLERPFPFIVQGRARRITYHVMNKPAEESQHTPTLHQKAKHSFALNDVTLQLLGFYSRQHEGVFTHRGSYIHVHVISEDRLRMGHLDQLYALPKTLRVSLPVE